MLQDVIRIAKEAGTIILAHEHAKAATKPDLSIVTEADIKANAFICKKLQHYKCPILAEESIDPKERLQSQFVWIVDPLDGTKHFARGEDGFSVMIGLVENGHPVLGVVYKPKGEICYFAEVGEGAHMQVGEDTPEQIHVTDNKEQLNYILSSGKLLRDYPNLKQELNPAKEGYIGSVGVKVGLIAQGKFDATLNTCTWLKEWDLCAPHIILKEAGGTITDLFGNPIAYNKQNITQTYGFLATNGACHQKVLTILTRFVQQEKGWKPPQK